MMRPRMGASLRVAALANADSHSTGGSFSVASPTAVLGLGTEDECVATPITIPPVDNVDTPCEATPLVSQINGGIPDSTDRPVQSCVKSLFDSDNEQSGDGHGQCDKDYAHVEGDGGRGYGGGATDVDEDSTDRSDSFSVRRRVEFKTFRDEEDYTSRDGESPPKVCTPRKPQGKNRFRVTMGTGQLFDTSRAHDDDDGSVPTEDWPTATATTASTSASLLPLSSSSGGSAALGVRDGNKMTGVNQNPFTPAPYKMGENAKRRREDEHTTNGHSREGATSKKFKDSNATYKSVYEREFEEVELIGKGEFGEVFKCIHRLDGLCYAVKKSKRRYQNRFEEKEALKEVWGLASLANSSGLCENIVRYFNSWAEDLHMYIQNEYCSGGNLMEYIEKNLGGVMDTAHLCVCLRHIAKGLNFMHRGKLAHMDIKPRNVMVSVKGEDEGPVYKLGDLGHVTSTVKPRVEDGDKRFLAQEIFNDDYRDLPKADIFALALTMVEVAGSRPLAGGGMSLVVPDSGAQYLAIRNDEVLPPLPRGISKGLKDLLQKMISRDPSKRPSAHEILDHAFLGERSASVLIRQLEAATKQNQKLRQLLTTAPESHHLKEGGAKKAFGVEGSSHDARRNRLVRSKSVVLPRSNAF